MILVHKKSFFKGLFMTVVFTAVLIVMFMPLFDGDNAFRASDKLFNSISKGSTDYIPGLQKSVPQYNKEKISLDMEMESEAIAEHATKLLSPICDTATSSGAKLQADCNLGKVLNTALVDATAMFHNDGEKVAKKYGIEERLATYSWWQTLKAVEKSLTNEERFSQAAFVKEVMARGVEVGYNFYKIEAETVSSKWGLLVFALVFYVLYTLWWGFAIYYLAEGLGLELKAGKKKEA